MYESSVLNPKLIRVAHLEQDGILVRDLQPQTFLSIQTRSLETMYLDFQNSRHLSFYSMSVPKEW